AMYRAITWHVVMSGVLVEDEAQVIALLRRTEVRCGASQGASTITINNIDPTPHLLTHDVNANVSTIATIPEVRRQLVSLQRAYANEYDSVMEGRDIGSAVFP